MKAKLTIYFILTVLLYIHPAYALDKVIIPISAIPETLDPSNTTQSDFEDIINLISFKLFNIGGDFQIDPILAERVSWEDHGKTVRIKLRDASFSNNLSITPAVVIDSLERCVVRSGKQLSVSLSTILGFEDFISGKSKHLMGMSEDGPRGISIKLRTPSPLILEDFSFTPCVIALPSKTGSYDFLKGANGNGPYEVLERTPEKIVLKKVKNCSYKCDGPDEVVFKKTDSLGDISKLKDDSDLITTKLTKQSLDKFNSYEYSELGTISLVMNHRKKPFSDASIRRAVRDLFNPFELAKYMNWPPSRIPEGLFPFGIAGFKQRKKNKNANEAMRKLGQLGFTKQNPLKFEVLIADSEQNRKEAVWWEKNFKNELMIPSFRVLSYGDILKIRNANSFDIIRLMKLPGTASGSRILGSYLSDSHYNTPGIRAKKCDKLVMTAFRDQEFNIRNQHFSEAESCYMDKVIMIPIISTIPGTVLIRQPWSLISKNRYWMTPLIVYNWIKK